MRIGGSILFTILAIVLFLVGAVLIVADDTPDPEVIQLLLFGGLASFAAGHLPLP